MTVIIGMLCEDGVVIGSDSSATYGQNPLVKTIEYEALKVEVLAGTVITAITGAVGLGQRFNEQVRAFFETIQAPNAAPPPQMMMGPFGPMMSPTQSLLTKVPQAVRPIDHLKYTDIGTSLAEHVISDFRRTQSSMQTNTPQGWGLGALVAFVKDDIPYLVEYDGIQFHPEFKGLPDPERGDRPRVGRAASMGAGQLLADSFLAHAYRLLFGERPPRIEHGKLVVSWALDHVIRYNTGGIGGKQQMAILEKNGNGSWKASHVPDPEGELRQQIDELERYISDYSRNVAHRAQTTSIPDAKEELIKGDTIPVAS